MDKIEAKKPKENNKASGVTKTEPETEINTKYISDVQNIEAARQTDEAENLSQTGQRQQDGTNENGISYFD